MPVVTAESSAEETHKIDRIRISRGMNFMPLGVFLLFIPYLRYAGMSLTVVGLLYMRHSIPLSGEMSSRINRLSQYLFPIAAAASVAILLLWYFYSQSVLASGVSTVVKQGLFDSSFMILIFGRAVLEVVIVLSLVMAVWNLTSGRWRPVLLASLILTAAISILMIYTLPASLLDSYNYSISTGSFSGLTYSTLSYAMFAPVYYFAPYIMLAVAYARTYTVYY